VGVVEVGMGGKLDATNILNNQIISIISMIARDHQNFLGHTLEDIAHHKAGILRPDTPYIVNPMNEWNVKGVIEQYAKEIGAGPQILPDTPALRKDLFGSKVWHKFADDLQPFQRDNGVLAYLAFVRVLEALGQNTKKAPLFLPHIKRKFLPGRLQTVKCAPVYGPGSSRKLLIDGAHNENAAGTLSAYVKAELRTVKKERIRSNHDREQQPITWVLAMTEGKDVRAYLRKLLRPGDNVVTTIFGPVDGMPWVKPMDPRELLRIALETEENITGVYMPTPGTFRALCAAKYLQWHTESTIPIVLTGSLYLVGDFVRDMRAYQDDQGYVDIKTIDREERFRINTLLSVTNEDQAQMALGSVPDAETAGSAAMRQRQLEDEIEKLNQEMLLLEQEESRLARAGSSDPGPSSEAARVPIPGFDSKNGPTKRDDEFAERNNAPANRREATIERQEAPAGMEETPAKGKLSYRYLRGDDNHTLFDQVESIRNRLQDLGTTPKPQPTSPRYESSDNDTRSPQYPKKKH
jgi:folylpolyglutamate synthase/dihydrofolate synthase